MTVKESLRPGQGSRIKMMTLSVFRRPRRVQAARIVGGGATDTVRYEQIAQVLIDRGFKWSRLAIESTGGGGFVIAGLNKNDADAAKALIDERISRLRSHAQGVPAADPSIADQITQLAALRESDALTEEEFTASKARLLNVGS